MPRELHRPQTGAARELEHPSSRSELVEFLADSLQLEKPPAIPFGTTVVTSLAQKPFVVLPGARPVVGQLPFEESLVHGVGSYAAFSDVSVSSACTIRRLP